MIGWKCPFCGATREVAEEEAWHPVRCWRCRRVGPVVPDNDGQPEPEWYWKTRWDESGPHHFVELKARVTRGLLWLDSHVRRGMEGEWQTVGSIEALRELAPGGASVQKPAPTASQSAGAPDSGIAECAAAPDSGVAETVEPAKSEEGSCPESAQSPQETAPESSSAARVRVWEASALGAGPAITDEMLDAIDEQWVPPRCPRSRGLFARFKCWGLRRRLRSSDHARRYNAVLKLEKLAGAEAVNCWIEALKDASEIIRCRAAEALGELGAIRAVPQLRKALRDSSESVSEAAARSLGLVGGASAVRPLMAFLYSVRFYRRRDDFTEAKEAALDSLARIGGQVLVPLFIDMLFDKELGVEGKAYEALKERISWVPSGLEQQVLFLLLHERAKECAQLGGQAVAPLVRFASEADVWELKLSRPAIAALEQMGNEQAIEALSQLAGLPKLRALATDALKSLRAARTELLVFQQFVESGMSFRGSSYYFSQGEECLDPYVRAVTIEMIAPYLDLLRRNDKSLPDREFFFAYDLLKHLVEFSPRRFPLEVLQQVVELPATGRTRQIHWQNDLGYFTEQYFCDVKDITELARKEFHRRFG